MATDRVTVQPGKIKVNEINLVSQSEDHVVYEADLRAKYAELIATGFEEDQYLVYLHADERTMHVENTDVPTTIAFPIPTVGWGYLAEVSRYTLYVSAYRINGQESVWRG